MAAAVSAVRDVAAVVGDVGPVVALLGALVDEDADLGEADIVVLIVFLDRRVGDRLLAARSEEVILEHCDLLVDEIAFTQRLLVDAVLLEHGVELGLAARRVLLAQFGYRVADLFGVGCRKGQAELFEEVERREISQRVLVYIFAEDFVVGLAGVALELPEVVERSHAVCALHRAAVGVGELRLVAREPEDEHVLGDLGPAEA